MAGNRKLLLISLDAVSSDDIKVLSKMPNFSHIIRNGTLVTNVKSVFVSNTYPAHTSVVTGLHPCKHGVIDNTLYQPHLSSPDWRWLTNNIAPNVPTLYDEARKKGLSVCSILWPVTGGADIPMNIPEIFQVRKNQNQAYMSLKHGSAMFQLGALIRHGRHLFSFSQPGVDNFAALTAAGVLRRKKPDLLMLHLSDVDHTKHKEGPDSDEAHVALDRQDLRLGWLLHALDQAGTKDDTDIIIFGDHGVLPVSKSVDLNKYFAHISGRAGFHQVGGTAFLRVSDPTDAALMKEVGDSFMAMVQDPDSAVARPLDKEEMSISGFDGEYVLGVEAKPGCWFGKGKKKGQHGYSLKRENYTTFYAALGKGITANSALSGGSILDICPLAAKLLDLPAWKMDGRQRVSVDDSARMRGAASQTQ